jgi:hypothetical protein
MLLTSNQRRCGHASLCWLETPGSAKLRRTNVEARIKSDWKIVKANQDDLEETREDN